VPLLEIFQLTRHFGGLAAVSELDLTVDAGEICGLIGPNGAGKSTALNMIGGTLLPTKGRIVLDGTDITRLPAYRRARLGIARVFQRNALFYSMTVLENVITASHLIDKHGFWELFHKGRSARAMESRLATRAMDILASVKLEHLADESASSLPHGDQRALCVAVALASEPRLLLLDEPLTGMNVEETTAMVGRVRYLRDTKGITVIVVEHNVKAVLGLCEHAVVLNYGKKMMEGTPRACVEDPRVIEAYLGTGQHVL
jgi:branched-chain amino acid transport system ATP-binding protein